MRKHIALSIIVTASIIAVCLCAICKVKREKSK